MLSRTVELLVGLLLKDREEVLSLAVTAASETSSAVPLADIPPGAPFVQNRQTELALIFLEHAL